jgi:hypothetical protein
MAHVSIKKGNPVEFSRSAKRIHTMGEGEIGIAIEDERADRTVTVELADGSTFLARHIHAYGWSGWLPEELETVLVKHIQRDDDYPDY